MVERKRERVLNVRILDTEAQMIADLADHEGVTVSEWIRNTIRVQHALLPKKPKRKK